MMQRIRSGPGVELEAMWDRPGAEDADATPEKCIVLCHPHPQQRGSMRAPLMDGITSYLVKQCFAVLRFNFRGVGASTGEWGGGVGELDDVSAAVATAAADWPSLPQHLAGWSFGAATALRWQARDQSSIPYVGIAPPVSSELTLPLPPPEALPPATRGFVIGDRDQFTSVDALAAYATSINAHVEVMKGSDHFFYFREERLAHALVELLGAARPVPEAGVS